MKTVQTYLVVTKKALYRDQSMSLFQRSVLCYVVYTYQADTLVYHSWRERRRAKVPSFEETIRGYTEPRATFSFPLYRSSSSSCSVVLCVVYVHMGGGREKMVRRVYISCDPWGGGTFLPRSERRAERRKGPRGNAGKHWAWLGGMGIISRTNLMWVGDGRRHAWEE